MVDDAVRLADLLAGLSLISDHGLGLPPDDAVRSCLVATKLARELGLHESEVACVFYDALLEHVGCTGYAHETYLVWNDDLAANRSAQRTNFADPKELVTKYLPSLLREGDGWERAHVAARFLTKGPGFLKRFATASCEVAAHAARRLGLPEEVQLSLRQYSEWWNGKGVPQGVEGEEIALSGRVVHVASVAAKFDVLGGPELAAEAVRRRAGSILDPAIAGTFVAHAAELLQPASRGDPRRGMLEAEPEPVRVVPAARLPELAAVFGDLADLKTPFMHGHSSGVARLARAAGESLGLEADAMAQLEVAALLHDVGRVAISNAVWEKPGPLTSGEWELVRLHPYHSERILSCAPVLRPMAALAGMHHERIDGSGYHRGCTGAQIPLPARVLAAADALQAMTQTRPHRDALTLDEAAERLQDEARAGRLDPDAVRALVDAAGGSPQTKASLRPAGLSEREVEVLRLVAEGLSKPADRTAPLHLPSHRRAPRPAHLLEDRRVQQGIRRALCDGARPPLVDEMGRSADADLRSGSRCWAPERHSTNEGREMSTSATARRFIDEVMSEGNLDLVDELFAPEYVGHPSGPEEPVRGPEGVKEYVAQLRQGVPDLATTVDDQVAEGDKVATRWTATGTHDGELMGMPATGRTATVTGITIQRIGPSGKIVEGWTHWDALGMLQQLGVAPQPAGG